MNTPTSQTGRQADHTRADGSIDDGTRYWWAAADEHQPHAHAFGEAAVQIVDEHAGGAIAYCHINNAQAITDALNNAHDSLIRIQWDNTHSRWTGFTRTTPGEDVVRLTGSRDALADMLDTAHTIATTHTRTPTSGSPSPRSPTPRHCGSPHTPSQGNGRDNAESPGQATGRG